MFLIRLSGNRSTESGLETVIMYYDRQSNGSPVVYGVCVNNPLAKFYSEKSGIPGTSPSERLLMKDEGGIVYLMHDLHGNYCTTSYQTERRETKMADDVLKLIETNQSNSIEHAFPMKHLIVDLLKCSFEEEYFLQLLRIDRLFFSTSGIKTQFISMVTELEIGISIQKLKPLTMMKGASAIIVVFSVTYDNTKFVIIRQ